MDTHEYTPEQRIAALWKKIDKSGGDDSCWIWMGSRHPQGYGVMRAGAKTIFAHRLAYEATYGPFLHELDVLHRCDNPPCCNPRHLFLGTHSENMADRKRKGRYSTMPRGEQHSQHKLTEVQVVEIRRLFASGQFTKQALGEMFGVHRSQIRRILTGATWSSASGE